MAKRICVALKKFLTHRVPQSTVSEMFTLMHNLADRLALLIAGVLRAVTAAGHRTRADEAVLTEAWWEITGRLHQRLLSLHGRFKAGRLGARKPAAPRPVAAAAKTCAAGRRAGPKLGPRVFGALADFAAEAAVLAGEPQAEFPLDAELAALVAAAPAEAGRILRPLCQLLGVAVPASLAVPARTRGRKAARTADTPHPPASGPIFASKNGSPPRAPPPGSSPGASLPSRGEGKIAACGEGTRFAAAGVRQFPAARAPPAGLRPNPGRMRAHILLRYSNDNRQAACCRSTSRTAAP